MGSRYNVFFADTYDKEINDAKPFRARMNKVLKLAVDERVKKAEQEWRAFREEGESDDGEEFEFDGYTGDIASGEYKLIYCKQKFTITDEQIELMEHGNDDWEFPYDDEWFKPIRECVEKHCNKWGPSLCVKINDRWAIMGFYSD